MAPWTGNTSATPEQVAEVQARTAADIQLIKSAFAHARDERSKAVVLMLQADMFDPTVASPSFSDYSAFKPIIETIAAQSARFGKPVYLFDGDSHVANVDKPLATGSPWLSFYGITTVADNLTRITVMGSTGVNEWLKVTIDPKAAQPVSWVHVPFV
jgi:hypothetical protein